MSDEGCISSVDALNAVGQLQFRMTMQDAADLIKRDWVFTDKWLKGVMPFNTTANDSMDTDDDQVN